MSEVFFNDTGCIITRSHITGDILCRVPGYECDCMMSKLDITYSYGREDEYAERNEGQRAEHVR